MRGHLTNQAMGYVPETSVSATGLVRHRVIPLIGKEPGALLSVGERSMAGAGTIGRISAAFYRCPACRSPRLPAATPRQRAGGGQCPRRAVTGAARSFPLVGMLRGTAADLSPSVASG